jgi:DNA segregation ATPase FtsK/SpoIIIE, S-DNA-T family
MPKSDTSNPIDGPSFQAARYRPNWIAAVLFFVAGAFLSVALIDYDPQQVGLPFRSTQVIGKNLMGWIGADAAWLLLFTVGVSTWLLPVFLIWLLYISVRNSKHLTGGRAVAMLLACVTFAGLAAMFRDAVWASDYFPFGYGGYVGRMLYHHLLADALGPFGSGLILSTVYAGSLLVVFVRDIGGEFEKIFAGFTAWRAAR